MSENKTTRDVAVALAYQKGEDAAPRVVAKGYGHVAQRIVELARENDIVIDTNAELAEALSDVGLDEMIPVELYKAVAEVIGYVLRTRERMR